MGFYDPWYHGGYYYDDPDIIVTPPPRPTEPPRQAVASDCSGARSPANADAIDSLSAETGHAAVNQDQD